MVDADMKSYFDTIPHALLMVEVEKFISDGKVLKLIQTYLEQDILDGMNRWTPLAGTPQGAVITPLTQRITFIDLSRIVLGRRFRRLWVASG